MAEIIRKNTGSVFALQANVTEATVKSYFASLAQQKKKATLEVARREKKGAAATTTTD